MGFQIIGTGRGLPALAVDNRRLAEFLDTSDEWIVSRTGISTRRVCTSESLTDLAETAARQALDKAGLPPGALDMILCATIGGDYVTPSLACCVAQRLAVTCPAMDLNGACVGFLYALATASAFLESGSARNILILGAERISAHVDWRDRATCVLFGDGAGACVVTKGDALRYLHLGCAPDTAPLRRRIPRGNSPFAGPPDETPEYLFMDGQAVFKFATRALESETKRAFETLGLKAEDIDLYLVHQANARILEHVRRKLKLPPEKIPINITRYANTSAASIPILLDELVEDGTIQPGQKLFLSAFGAGLTYGAAVLDWRATE
jgi:3-oxoacyl-[acyl-carrier-protein] synthase-3